MHLFLYLQVKYTMVAETRNHAIAAIQNISTAYGSLKPVTAPYCTPDDLEVSDNCSWLPCEFKFTDLLPVCCCLEQCTFALTDAKTLQEDSSM